MAKIREFQELKDDVQWHRTEVDCYYRSVEWNGERRLHLASFGSDHRKTSGVSQTFQIDAKAAQELINILRASFPETE